MTKFESWCDSKGYTVNSGIHTHVLSSWADEYARYREMELLDRIRIYKQISVIGTAKMLTNEVLLADIIETT